VKYLQIVNVAVLLAGAVMALNLAVVCLLYAVHLDSEPRLGEDLPGLYTLTALFTGLGLAGAAAFFGQRRHWPGRWLLQVLPVVPVAGIVAFLIGLRR
jgi:hypothetical protein